MELNPGVGLKAGDVLDGRYTLRDCVAQGGMGTVFVADQHALQRTVAIKLLHPELAIRREHAQRIRDEAVAASRVRSPHCVKVIDCSALPSGTPYLVMEHVPGRSLRSVIAEDVISLPRALDLFEQILRALDATHSAGIVHADVKSDNFLVEVIDGKDHVTMIDFGLAREAGTPVRLDVENGETMVSGTPEYMAPEVASGKPAIPASDIYGAGVILYELLTGTMPFTGRTSAEIMTRQLQDLVIPPSLRCQELEIPSSLDRIVMRALDKRPTARFADAASFARELRAAMRGKWATVNNAVRRDVGSTSDALNRFALTVRRRSSPSETRPETRPETRGRQPGQRRPRGAGMASGELGFRRPLRG